MRRNMRTKAIITSSIVIIFFSIAIGALIYYFATGAVVDNISESLTEIAYLALRQWRTTYKEAWRL